MKISRFFACAATALLSLTLCTDSRLSGPSTEEGNPQIVAIVVDNDKNPVAGATVVTYRVLDNGDSTQQPASAVRVAEQLTGADGKCSFSNIAPGNYSLSASDSSANLSALKSDITISDLQPRRPDFTDTIVLVAPGGIKGVVSRGGVMGNATNQNLSDAFIQVKIGEIDRSTVTGPDGKYSFANLPMGVYTIYYYATDGFYSSKRENVGVRPGVDTTLDSVVLRPVPRLLPPKGFRADYDTVAGIVNLYWQKVFFDSLRWYEVKRINLTAPGETVYIAYDTLFSDTVSGIPAGTILDYVVRSVDKAFNPSPNAGPVEITVINHH